jgi:hypothetical protein
MRLNSKSNSSRPRLPDSRSAADCEIDEALWAAYRRYDKSAVTKQLLRRYLTAGAAVATNEEDQIVIAGGGFAGLYAAKYFHEGVACRADVEVTLISRCRRSASQ